MPQEALTRGYDNLSAIVAKIDSGAANPDDGYYSEAPQATMAYAEYLLAQNGQADVGLLRRYHDAAAFVNDNDGAGASMSRWYWQGAARRAPRARPADPDRLPHRRAPAATGPTKMRWRSHWLWRNSAARWRSWETKDAPTARCRWRWRIWA